MILQGQPVRVDALVVADNGDMKVSYRRSLVRRVFSGRTVDVEPVMEPTCYHMKGFGFIMHPAIYEQIKAAGVGV